MTRLERDVWVAAFAQDLPGTEPEQRALRALRTVNDLRALKPRKRRNGEVSSTVGGECLQMLREVLSTDEADRG